MIISFLEVMPRYTIYYRTELSHQKSLKIKENIDLSKKTQALKWGGEWGKGVPCSHTFILL